MEPRLKWNKWVTNGGLGTKFFKIILFHTEPRLKWNKNVLAIKTILFHFGRGSVVKYNTKTF